MITGLSCHSKISYILISALGVIALSESSPSFRPRQPCLCADRLRPASQSFDPNANARHIEWREQPTSVRGFDQFVLIKRNCDTLVLFDEYWPCRIIGVRAVENITRDVSPKPVNNPNIGNIYRMIVYVLYDQKRNFILTIYIIDRPPSNVGLVSVTALNPFCSPANCNA